MSPYFGALYQDVDWQHEAFGWDLPCTCIEFKCGGWVSSRLSPFQWLWESAQSLADSRFLKELPLDMLGGAEVGQSQVLFLPKIVTQLYSWPLFGILQNLWEPILWNKGFVALFISTVETLGCGIVNPSLMHFATSPVCSQSIGREANLARMASLKSRPCCRVFSIRSSWAEGIPFSLRHFIFL
jgi:hypothetical protein